MHNWKVTTAQESAEQRTKPEIITRTRLLEVDPGHRYFKVLKAFQRLADRFVRARGVKGRERT